MQKFDITIVGGGMVGLASALAIRSTTDLSIAIIEPQPLNELANTPHLRVSAINAASQQLLKNLGVWNTIIKQRAQAYENMHVWDKDGYGHLDFGVEHLPKNVNKNQGLGHIIENDVIRNALWHKAQQDTNITIISEQLTSIAQGDSEVFLSFAENTPIISRLVIAADGANSWVRKQLNMEMTFRDYDHHAVVATVDCEQGHQQTAWQVFLETGPLAFLPLYQQAEQADHCSIVWSLPPAKAEQVKALNQAEFNKSITAASDGKLGRIQLKSERVSFPLTMRLARDFVRGRVVLIGDAAHTIHPLAGQGVNLGFVDAAAIADTLRDMVSTNKSLNDSKLLGQFARYRKSDAVDMMAAMESIKQGFSLQQKLPKIVRGVGMSLLNNAPLLKPILKPMLIKQALGLRDDLPSLLKAKDPLSL
ncbi:FAD-dependent monooxygenase [Thalassotalea crassostreae]|uniref:FAD-dependent monooxygenase n=1 Tax=Thalassotalea crassostreae TaxID=1763536 RepID=UPI000838967D|nr:FAD-dependent monooxygenase [Thalassotalea crassostreae]